jgi:hypothetical protein
MTELEERLVSIRIPFIQIKDLRAGRQQQLHGSIVNVPADVQSTISELPREIDSTKTIPVILKRKKEYKRPYRHETIRPHKVFESAKYLSSKEWLKNKYKYQVDLKWLDRCNYKYFISNIIFV